MNTTDFQRARSPEAKRHRELAILDAARRLATERGVRPVTLTDIAGEVGMHKSALLRYFETREQIFLMVTADCWQEWSRALHAQLHALELRRDAAESVDGLADAVAVILASSLSSRPLFCDLIAQAPLNLERNVSIGSVRSYKTAVLGELGALSATLRDLLPLDERQARNVVGTATAMAGALWQMAAPGTQLRELYETDPALSHAVVDLGPEIAHVLSGLLAGYTRRP